MARPRPPLLTLVLAALALCAIAAPALAQSKGVVAYDAEFSPSWVSIDEGDTVTWTNVGETVHNLIGNSSNWPAGERLLVPGGSTTIQFNRAASYSYTCEYHPTTMYGNVLVESGPGPQPTATASPSPRPSGTAGPPPPLPTGTPSSSPTPSPTATGTASPSPTPPLIPTDLPSFGFEPQPGQGPGNPELAAGSLTPPPDSPMKPPLTILGAIAAILLFAANPLLKRPPEPARVPVRRPQPGAGRRPRPSA